MKMYYVIRQSIDDPQDAEYCYNNTEKPDLKVNTSFEHTLEEAIESKDWLDDCYGDNNDYSIYEILGE